MIENSTFTLPYYTDAYHALLSDRTSDVLGPNIRIDGRNLTVIVLSLNRTHLTVRLLRSIYEQMPGFKGQILIGDNGSKKHELSALKDFVSEYKLDCSLFEFGANLGVAGGRNRLVAEVSTDWCMSLDNDIYFISNPLHDIQQDLAILGCHFISVPLLNPDRRTLYAYGGSLTGYLERLLPRLTIRSIVPTNSDIRSVLNFTPGDRGFLCSFLYGGSSIMNVRTFQKLGAYDSNMLVGFEDVDFSLRLFREGYKVGSSVALALVHDHEAPLNEAADDYERLRFSREILRDSASYLEGKTGLIVPSVWWTP